MTTTAQEHSARLADLLRREHLALAEFLVALSEFDGARGWVALGFASLFDYLHRSLGLSKGAAFYRMTAARLIQSRPEVVHPLKDGRLCLSTIVELSKALEAGGGDEVVSRFFHASKREAKAVVAELLPAASVPTRTIVTALRAGTMEVALSAQDAASSLLRPADLGQLVGRPTDQVPAPPPAAHRSPAPVLIEEPKTAELSRIHVTVPRRFLKKIEEARAALSHSLPRATEDEILEVGLDLIIARHAKRRGIGAKPRLRAPRADAPAAPTPAAPTTVAAAAPPPPKRSRHVPAHVWRAVWERDGGRCVWPVDGGGVCGSTHKLQLDHVDGWALGADTTVERCRLLCAPHNDQHARELYGDELMDRYTRPKRGPGCGEPVAEYPSGEATPCGEAAPRVRRTLQANPSQKLAQLGARHPARLLPQRVAVPVRARSVHPELIGHDRIARKDDRGRLPAMHQLDTDGRHWTAVMSELTGRRPQRAEQDGRIVHGLPVQTRRR